MSDAVPAQPYLDGASAEDAFQGLVDRGLLADQVPAPAAAPTAPAVAQAAAPAAAPVAQAAPAPAAEAPEGEDYANLDDFLAKHTVDRASFLELPVTVKVDGKESALPLKDLLRSYQTDAHVTQRSQQLAEQQRSWEAEREQAKQVLTQNLTTAQQLVQLAHRELMNEYQTVNWEQLKATDPAQFAVKSLELQQRFGGIQQQLQQVNQLAAQQQQEAQARQAQQLDVERAKMLEAIPEWSDTDKFQTARAELTSYAKANGFNDAEIAAVYDHRYMKILHDASRYAALQAKSPAVLKIVRSAPPMAAPGARTQRDPSQARFQQARDGMKRDPRNEDAQVAAFSALVDRGV